jgi:hypothetical protein
MVMTSAMKRVLHVLGGGGDMGNFVKRLLYYP